PGEGGGIGGGREDLARPARREHHRFGLYDVDLAGRELVGDDPGGPLVPVALPLVVEQQQVEDVELVEELHVVLDALLVQRLQDHVPGPVRGVAGAAHGGLPVVTGVPAEAALVDPPLRGAVERQAHLLQVEDGVDGLLGHHFRGVLVNEVVPTLDGVEGVPFPVVVLYVRQRGAHHTLGRDRVGAGGVEIGDDGGACPFRGFQGRAHAGATGANDYDVVAVCLHYCVSPRVRLGRTRAAVRRLRRRSRGRR